MPSEFFPPRPDASPMIYAYSEPNNSQVKGMLKVGYTAVNVEKRVSQQFPTLKPGEKPYNIVFAEPAMRTDGTVFMDHEVHENLEANGFYRLKDSNGKKTEWFSCRVSDVKAAYIAVRDRTDNKERRTREFEMRPEQREAVKKTAAYYRSVNADSPERTPKFLWNAKMRFGKTFASYELAKEMGFKRVLVLTFKPAVQDAWEEDLTTHVDFEGWQFVSRAGKQYEDCDPSRPIVCFGSFQDYLGVNTKTGGIKAKNEWVHLEDWDLVIFDEYHFGAWKDNAKGLFQKVNEDDFDDVDREKANSGDAYDETYLPIQTKYYLFLSGTPFRALNSGEFIEEQVYNWTYSDEQEAKEQWPSEHLGEANPYESLPRMVMMTYKIPDDITKIAQNGEFDSFDLNAFFEAEGKGKAAKFKFKEYVQKWLDLLRGAYKPFTVDDLKLGAQTPPFPYKDVNLLRLCTHTLWFMPSVASCHAMANLLAEPQNAFYHDYTVNVCAGTDAGIGLAALEPVRESMADPLHSKSITLSCGKLTTGVTIKPWGGILMLRNLSSPETYFQAAFRVQSPWTLKDDLGHEEVVKKECYVFDFSLNRSLRMISDYGRGLGDPSESPEKLVGDFINFLPVLAFDGSAMRQVNAAEILDITMAGTSATLLARRWESALLVNVDNDTLRRLLASEEAINALMRIEGFRSLNDDIRTIISKSEAVKKAKREKQEMTPKEKKQLTEEEKEFKSKRKEIQEKLIKFATRIPIFMYLTDYREETLKDVITQLEPGLFKKVTGLDVKDFELLVSLGVFNDTLMNDAVYKFRRYEDSSLSYTGINKHEGERVGLFDTSLSAEDYAALYLQQQGSMAVEMGTNASSTQSAASAKVAKKPKKTVRSDINIISKERDSSGDDIVEVEFRPAASTQPVAEDDWVCQLLNERKIAYIDKRYSKGCLWVTGKHELDKVMAELKAMGAEFKFSYSGGKATKHQSAWFLNGYPEKKDADEKDKTLVTQEQLDALKIGDTVFHKAFGYGEILDLDEEYITIDFHEGKKKPFRKFIFPGPFYQGILQIG